MTTKMVQVRRRRTKLEARRFGDEDGGEGEYFGGRDDNYFDSMMRYPDIPMVEGISLDVVKGE
jgi:hypothetical protein